MERTRKNSKALFVFLTGTVLVGVLLGTLSCSLTDLKMPSGIEIIEKDFLEKRKSQNFGQILSSSLGTGSVFLLIFFLCGFSPVGQIISAALLLFRGTGLGTVISQLYISGGKSMMPYSCLLFIPGAALSTWIMIIAARLSAGLSGIYLRHTLSEKPCDGLLGKIKIYGAKFLVLEALLSLSACIDCICTLLFIGKF